MQIISKKDAIDSGQKYFFTGIPCKNGHVAQRTVERSDCVECLNARKRAWANRNAEYANEKSRQWYQENTERAKETRARWRQENAEKDRADIAAYQAAHKEHLAERAAFWRANNVESRKSTRAIYLVENAEHTRKVARLWARSNPDKINARKAKRIAAQLQAMPSWADTKAIAEIYKQASEMSKRDGIPYHVDHIVPIRSKWVCGLHVEYNLQILPGSENQAKGNRHWPGMYKDVA